MANMDTDYFIVGSGASGLAFADTLVQETDAHITIVDRHAKPGGHWNDAYPFVALHQPSAFYGVNSLDLGTNRKDTIGVNQGLYELATGPEVSGYYDKVMSQKLLPSGRVSYYPMCNYLGADQSNGQSNGQLVGSFESILSGQKTQVTVRKKLVDANYFGPKVPSTHNAQIYRSRWCAPGNAQCPYPAVARQGRQAHTLRHYWGRQNRYGRRHLAAELRRTCRGHHLGDAARLLAGEPPQYPARR